jgi:plastocyanin
VTFALAADPVKLDIPVLVGVFGAAVVIVLAFAAATGWIGRIGALQTGEPEELEPVVAGIGIGTAGVPRWLYAAYVVIPLWAMFFLVSNTKVAKEKVPEAKGAAATAAPKAGAAAASSEVRITAKNVAFTKKSVALKAGPDTITFRNDDASTDHNIAISKDNFASFVFTGAIIKGPASIDYKVTLQPGSYVFRCDVHTSMTGTLTVT